MTPTFTRDEILELATEYRPSMPEDVLHLWARDAVYVLRSLIAQPKIKPLQWEKHPSADMWRAFTIVGVYTVSTIIDVLWVFDGYENGCQDAVDARDELDAKAACQADFNDRIKSVLERPNPSLT